MCEMRGYFSVSQGESAGGRSPLPEASSPLGPYKEPAVVPTPPPMTQAPQNLQVVVAALMKSSPRYTRHFHAGAQEDSLKITFHKRFSPQFYKSCSHGNLPQTEGMCSAFSNKGFPPALNFPGPYCAAPEGAPTSLGLSAPWVGVKRPGGSGRTPRPVQPRRPLIWKMARMTFPGPWSPRPK